MRFWFRLPWWLLPVIAAAWLITAALLVCLWLVSAAFALAMAGLFAITGDRQSARQFASKSAPRHLR